MVLTGVFDSVLLLCCISMQYYYSFGESLKSRLPFLHSVRKAASVASLETASTAAEHKRGLFCDLREMMKSAVSTTYHNNLVHRKLIQATAWRKGGLERYQGALVLYRILLPLYNFPDDIKLQYFESSTSSSTKKMLQHHHQHHQNLVRP